MIACLGKSLRKDGTPEPELLIRCQKAYEVHMELGYPIITSGADPAKIGITEAEFMKSYLIKSFGCDPTMILKEEKANNTIENFINTLEIAKELGVSKLIIVTCQNHMPRAKLLCQTVLSHFGNSTMQLSGQPSRYNL